MHHLLFLRRKSRLVSKMKRWWKIQSTFSVLTLLVIESTGLFSPRALIKLAGSDGAPQDLGSVHTETSYGPRAVPIELLTEPSPPELNRRVTEYAEVYRAKLRTGNDIVPSLDPLHLKSLPPLKFGYIVPSNMRMKLKEVKVHGLSDFHIDNIQTRFATRRVDFEISFPQIKIELMYSFRARSLLGMMSYEPSGKFVLTATPVRTRGHVQIAVVKPPNKSSFFNVKDMELIIDSDSVEVSLSGLVNSKSVKFILASFASFFKNSNVDSLGQSIVQYATKSTVVAINKKLREMGAATIISKVAMG